MDAPVSRRLRRPALFTALAALCSVISGADLAQGAGYRTVNFTVDAPTPQLAKEIGDYAEQWRRELAIEWLGKLMALVRAQEYSATTRDSAVDLKESISRYRGSTCGVRYAEALRSYTKRPVELFR